MKQAESPGTVLVGGLDSQMDLAMELREKGIRVLALEDETKEEAALRQAIDAGFPFVVLSAGTREEADAAQFRLVEVTSGDSLIVPRDELAGRIAG